MNEIKPTILMVEDEPEVLKINARMMKRRGYNVLMARSAKESYSSLAECTPDLLVLDIMLPDGSGYDICEKFRKTSDNPVMFLTGKDEVSDKVEGLGRGGDYYLTKPYSFDELLAIIERLLSRHFKTKEKYEQLTVITKGSLTLDISKSKAFINEKDTGLTAKEFAMLLLLVKNEDKIFSARELYETIWGMPSTKDTRVVRFHIGNLKRKINAENAKDYDIISTYGRGYSFTTN